MDWCLIADLSGALGLTWTILKVAIGLGLVIFVHELGHFIAAKSCGVKCEKFYIGFDIPVRLGPLVLPSALCKFRWGETEYGIGILPLGGYVKMLGQDDNPTAQARENERIKVLRNATDQSSNVAPSVDQRAAAASPKECSGSPAGQAESSTATSPASETEYVLDPRSFPAKPVLQRMIIISAGVIMNLISAVIFAAVAYRAGVSYTPCVIGGTAPGDPAWVLGLEPGDKIVQIGRAGESHDDLRFQKDLMPRVMLHGAESKLDLLIRPRGQEEAKWISVQPSDRLKDLDRPATLGVRPPSTTKLSLPPREEDEEARFTDAGHKSLQNGDEVVAVNGQALPRDTATGEILGYHLEAQFAQHVSESVKLTLQRHKPQSGPEATSEPTTLDIELPPTKMRTLGLTMKAGAILGVREGSPAAAAGFRVGDVLVSVQGEEVGDPLTLAQRLLPLVGQEIEIRVTRENEKEPVALHVTPQLPASYEANFGPSSLVSLETIGVALRVENIVVQAEGPASQAGLLPGDELTKVQPVVTDPVLRKNALKRFGKSFDKPIELSSKLPNWPYAHSFLQLLRPGTEVQLTYLRGGVEKTATLMPVDSNRWFEAARGLHLKELTQVRTADSWGESLALGYRETAEKLEEVLIVLKLLFTGKVPLSSLGGPVMIATVAGSEANAGIPRLLIFLTFLSANLAVLNFLPIPALDGGHLVFLTLEGIRGKPVGERLQITLTLIGVALLLALMVLVFGNDIRKLFF